MVRSCLHSFTNQGTQLLLFYLFALHLVTIFDLKLLEGSKDFGFCIFWGLLV
uniref:Uncharacterized protein n=1 Tax=Rhizophora mucronata TaxID=61149 RepID=A0A2P2KCW2_RHIMU